jgi:fatty acid desaturase
MTRYFLEVGQQLGGHPLAQFVGLLIVVLLLIPAALVDAFVALVGLAREHYWLTRDQAPCTRGHTVRLWGSFTCPSCKLEIDHHAFAACPHCGERAYAIRCPCGSPVVNPLSRGQS